MQITKDVKVAEKFGNIEKYEAYRKIRDFVVKNKVLRLYQKKTHENGDIEIVICNLFKLVKVKGSFRINTFKLNIEDKAWMATNPDDFPLRHDICLLPIENAKSGEHVWKSILDSAIGYMMAHFGLYDRYNQPKGIRNHEIKKMLIARYAGQLRGGQSKGGKKFKPKIYTAGIVSTKTWKTSSRALIKNIWTEFIDKALLKAIVSKNGYGNTLLLSQYMEIALYGEHFIRHYQERPNLIPLLQYIPKEEWHRDDLFSRALWVKGDRKTTVVDRMKEMNRTEKTAKRIKSFDKKSHYKWIFSKSNRLISYIFTLRAIEDAKFLCDIQIPNGLPYNYYAALMSVAHKFRNLEPVKKEHLIKLVLKHLLNVRQEIGKKESYVEIQNIKHSANDMADWLRAEGYAQGFPQKNSTWPSLMERSNQWHIMIQQKRSSKSFEWTSLIDEFETEQFKVTPLLTSKELIDEGARQSHCVGGGHYDEMCYRGQYRVFNITNKTTRRKYTLCIALEKNAWYVQQVRGKANSVSPKEVEALSKSIAERYTSLTRTQMNKKIEENEAA